MCGDSKLALYTPNQIMWKYAHSFYDLPLVNGQYLYETDTVHLCLEGFPSSLWSNAEYHVIQPGPYFAHGRVQRLPQSFIAKPRVGNWLAHLWRIYTQPPLLTGRSILSPHTCICRGPQVYAGARITAIVRSVQVGSWSCTKTEFSFWSTIRTKRGTIPQGGRAP